MKAWLRYTTPSAPCAYLPGREARLEVTYFAELSGEEYERELAGGLRRMGFHFFRAACPACSECRPIRVPVRLFRPSKSQRRVLRRNADLTVEVGEPRVDPERLELHDRFHADRERRLGWPPSRIAEDGYRATFVDNPIPTLEFRYRLGEKLLAVAYVDESPEALNSIYAFHDPEHARRSLGTFDVLCELALARDCGKEYLYLGYLVAGCRSMEYKRNFRPCEVLAGGVWSVSD